ncbi:MAG: (2Fe-2S)-binding protein [Zoogloeaceae bacterium]|jgi:[NiFe] hydrogenase diaphorase moiety small subunit|nr:(2Fe-2S)-binding protein [Zoogloeaceae bacterium]
MSHTHTFTLDGQTIPFTDGQSVMEAASAAGVYIPHLCHHPEFKPQGSCKLCTVRVNGRNGTSCTMRAVPGMVVESDTEEINARRRTLVQMLFVEGNHFCPACEKSGNCQLQAIAYRLGVMSPHFDHFFPNRTVDASHPDVLLDFNRCILCSLCVRASRDVDGKNVFAPSGWGACSSRWMEQRNSNGKNVFALSGRGIQTHVIVNAKSGRLADTDFSLTDKAAEVCPVGAILKKRQGFAVPIGKRRYDKTPIGVPAEES